VLQLIRQPPFLQGTCEITDRVACRVEYLTHAFAEGSDDGVQVDRVEDVGDHFYQILQTGFEQDFGFDVLDQEADFVDTEIDAGVEGEEVEDLGVEVDFGGEVVYLDVYCLDVD